MLEVTGETSELDALTTSLVELIVTLSELDEDVETSTLLVVEAGTEVVVYTDDETLDTLDEAAGTVDEAGPQSKPTE
jgi:hypothetical protein